MTSSPSPPLRPSTAGPNTLTLSTDGTQRFSADVWWNDASDLTAVGAKKDTFCLDFPGDPATAVDPNLMLSPCGDNLNNQKFAMVTF